MRKLIPFKRRRLMRPIDQSIGRGLRLAGQRGGCCGCKKSGKGLNIAGQRGGNLRQMINRKIINPTKRWFSRHDDDILDGLNTTANVAAKVAPFMAFV